MNLFKNIIFLFISLVFTSSCISTSQKIPLWIINEPSSNDHYWVGIGSVEKPFPDNYREIAHQRALNQIASQIKVEIKSELTSVVQELNFNLDEYSRSVINSLVSQEIDFVEYVDSYESKNAFSVYAQLSISKYFAELERKQTSAKEASLEYLTQADPFNVNSFNLLSLAFLEIESYLDQNLDVSDPFNENRSINLATLIQLKLFDFLDRIHVVPETNPYKIKQFSGEESLYKAKCLDKKTGKALSNIPIAYKINSGADFKFVTSNEEGFITIDPFKGLGTERLESITHGFDIKKLIDKSVLTMVKKNIRYYRIPFRVKELNIFVNTEESNLDRSLDPPFISSAIKEYFSKSLNCRFTDQKDSDYSLNLKVSTIPRTKEKSESGFYFVYANAEISFLSSKDQKELYSKSFNQIKGGHIDLNLAGMKSLDNLLKKINAELPVMISNF